MDRPQAVQVVNNTEFSAHINEIRRTNVILLTLVATVLTRAFKLVIYCVVSLPVPLPTPVCTHNSYAFIDGMLMICNALIQENKE